MWTRQIHRISPTFKFTARKVAAPDASVEAGQSVGSGQSVSLITRERYHSVAQVRSDWGILLTVAQDSRWVLALNS